MRVALDVSHYLSQEVFQRERRGVFGATWLYAGLLEDLEQENQFITCTHAGREIVVQRMAGALRAFVNSCAHRRSRIQTTATGQRPLICPYHGWAYDHEGCLLQRPKLLEESSQDGTIRLTALRVESVGPLVFVHPAAEGPSLRDFLGAFHARLTAMAPGMGRRQHTTVLPIAANWKVAVENTLEFHHVGLVHRQTFAKLGAREQAPVFERGHSGTEAALAEQDARRSALAAKLAARQYRSEGYEHLLVFPNLTLATTQGLSFSIQYFHPVDAGQTVLTTTTLACAAASGESFNDNLAAAVAQQAGVFNEAVFAEDRAICEAVQQGMHSADHAGLLTRQESRLAHFHAHYLQQLEH